LVILPFFFWNLRRGAFQRTRATLWYISARATLSCGFVSGEGHLRDHAVLWVVWRLGQDIVSAATHFLHATAVHFSTKCRSFCHGGAFWWLPI